MKAYKGFDKNMQCRGFLFREGETYHEDKAKLCEAGFHACEAPLDVFRYYAPADSVYREVELENVSDESEDGSKMCAKTIKVGGEISILRLIKAQIEYVKSRTTTEHADPEAATAGYRGAATAGYRGAATAGDFGAATSRGRSKTGENGVCVARGENAMVSGGIGTVLVIARENSDKCEIAEWKAEVVDGDKIKADTWYRLENGEFEEAENG